ncbi:MAG: hypothetical protein HQL53_09925, partial [Magnetococcales bacterium]|nr:hypothetical protein [Magnetococcales bacterium]
MAASRSLLARRDPRAKLLAFFLLLPPLMSHPAGSRSWLLGILLLLAALAVASLHPRDLMRQWFRLRWFMVTLMLLHSCLTPGRPLWEGAPIWLTHEGLVEGVMQCIRLAALAGLAWILTRVTSSWELLTAFDALDRLLGRMGFSIGRSLARVGFTLERLPFLFREAQQILETLQLRVGPPPTRHLLARMFHLIRTADALLTRLFRDLPPPQE